ncbi:MAG: TonB-dependent receptor [Bacteroidetes bacterium]|nr:TonB-dependent receptor [Bacteroidota bacterium]
MRSAPGILLAVLVSFFSISVNAQQNAGFGKVTGRLVGAKKSPVSYATVTLLRADSSVAGGDLSQDNGSFTIAPTGAGKFMLRITAIGYKERTISDVVISQDEPNKAMGNITLSQTEEALKEVQVVGEKAMMEMKVDKKVFNVDKNITTAGGSAADVLQNVPSVSVDADGNLSLRGKSDVTVLIDGKPATLLGSDVPSALQSLSASSIESVEVITNPSAKYDAQGMTGIVNIITKKDRAFGINGNINAGAGTHDKYNAGLGLNAHKKNWNIFLNSNLRINKTWNDVITNRYDKIPDSTAYYTYEHVPRNFSGWFNTLGGSWDWNKHNSITLTGNFNLMRHAFEDYSDYYTMSPVDPTVRPFVFDTAYHDARQYRYSNSAAHLRGASASLNYKHKFSKKDEELTLDANYSNFYANRTSDYVTNNYYPAYADTINEHAPGSGHNNTFTASLDYVNPLFTPNGKFSAGLKTQINSFNSTNVPVIDTADRENTRRTDTTLWAAYNYTQQVHAAYVNWNDQLGKFSYQLGLRLEDAIYDGKNKVPVDTNFSNSFLGLFPSAFISYQLPAQQSVYLNYSRRTNRPNFFQMMPYKDLSNPSTVSVGNPDLVPEFIHNVELSYNKQTKKGDNFIASVYYQNTRNLIERVIRTYNTGEFAGRLYSQPLNIASGTTYGLDLTGRFQLLPIWDATLNINAFQNMIKVGSSDTSLTRYLSDIKGFSWFGKLNTNLRLPAGFSLQLNGNYESPKVVAQGNVKESYWVDAALKKSFWKGKASVTVNCSDIFKTRRFINEYDLAAYSQEINRIKETRIGNISFTYRFGKSGDSGSKGPEAQKRKAKPAKDNAPVEKDRENNLKQGDDDNGGGGGNGGGSAPPGNNGGR